MRTLLACLVLMCAVSSQQNQPLCWDCRETSSRQDCTGCCSLCNGACFTHGSTSSKASSGTKQGLASLHHAKEPFSNP